MEVHAFSPSSQKSQRRVGEFFCVGDRLGIHSKYQANQGYKWVLVFKKKKNIFKGNRCLLIVTLSWTLTLILDMSRQPERTVEMK